MVRDCTVDGGTKILVTRGKILATSFLSRFLNVEAESGFYGRSIITSVGHQALLLYNSILTIFPRDRIAILKRCEPPYRH